MPETQTKHSIHYSLKDLSRAVSELLTEGRSHCVWLFYGGLGAGKTTLIKNICKHFGVQDGILSSPTFSIINEYPSPSGDIYHFDFYRLKNESEILDLGVEEYFDSGKFCFVEWPERLGRQIPSSFFKISITHSSDTERIIEYEKYA